MMSKGGIKEAVPRKHLSRVPYCVDAEGLLEESAGCWTSLSTTYCRSQDLEKPIMLCLLGTGMIRKLDGGETELQDVGRRIIPETHLFLHSVLQRPILARMNKLPQGLKKTSLRYQS